jgi:hypothetical protein
MHRTKFELYDIEKNLMNCTALPKTCIQKRIAPDES